MKKVFIVCVCCFCLSILQSCGKIDSRKDTNNEVQITISSDKLKLSNLVAEMEIVPLETNENCLVGNISKLMFYDNKVFILDRFVSKGLFVFDAKGRFLYRVGKVGRGPGEFNTPIDFTIDWNKKELLILDNPSRLIFYDITGEYKGKTIDLLRDKGGTFSIVKTKNGYATIAGSREDHLKLLDNNFNYVNSFFPFLNPDIDGGIYPNPLQVVDDDLVLYRKYCDNTVYRIEKDTILPYKRFVFPFGNIKYQDLKSDTNFKEIKNSYFLIKNFISSSNQIYLVFRKKQDYYIAFFGSKSSKIKAFKFSNFENDITFDSYCSVFGIDRTNNRFIWGSSPERINKAIKEKNIILKENSPLKGLNAEDNPVLLFTKMK